MSMVDEELLKPIRELLVLLCAKIEGLREETHQKIERYGCDDRAYQHEKWREFWQAIEPIQREREAVVKIIADYYNLQSIPTMIITRPPVLPVQALALHKPAER